MESLTETLLFILPWILLGTSLILYGHTITQYTSVRQQLEEAQNIIFISGKKLGEQSIELEETKEEARKWEKLATCPPISPIPDPVFNIISYEDNQLLCSRTLLPYNDKGRHNPEDIKRAESGFLKDISSFIYSELTDKGYEAEYYQEIYIAKPKKLHYEKGH